MERRYSCFSSSRYPFEPDLRRTRSFCRPWDGSRGGRSGVLHDGLGDEPDGRLRGRSRSISSSRARPTSRPASFHALARPGPDESLRERRRVEARSDERDRRRADHLDSGEILVAERIYNQAPGDGPWRHAKGSSSPACRRDFSISLGQSASIQGINQGGSENFRYNFALVETGGGSPTVQRAGLRRERRDSRREATTRCDPYEQLQPNVADRRARRRDDERPDHGDGDGRDGLRPSRRRAARERSRRIPPVSR